MLNFYSSLTPWEKKNLISGLARLGLHIVLISFFVCISYLAYGYFKDVVLISDCQALFRSGIDNDATARCRQWIQHFEEKEEQRREQRLQSASDRIRRQLK